MLDHYCDLGLANKSVSVIGCFTGAVWDAVARKGG